MPNLEMKRYIVRVRSALIMIASVFLTFAVAAQEKKLEVVTSFSILADFVRQIGGERVQVASIIKPGADAHVYRATPQDVKTIGAAGLLVINGLGFDPFMERAIRAAATKTTVVVAAKDITPVFANPAKAHAHGHSHAVKSKTPAVDPHAWQSIGAAKTYVLAIRDGLVSADPAGKAFYEAKTNAYLNELAVLEAEILALFAPISPERRVIVTSHDSFAYLARDLGLTIEPIQGLSTEAEPNARDVARILKAVRERKARAVFLEAISSPRLAEQIIRETGAKLGGTLFSDALSDDKGPAPTYIAMMRHNARMIAAALAQ